MFRSHIGNSSKRHHSRPIASESVGSPGVRPGAVTSGEGTDSDGLGVLLLPVPRPGVAEDDVMVMSLLPGGPPPELDKERLSEPVADRSPPVLLSVKSSLHLSFIVTSTITHAQPRERYNSMFITNSYLDL